jgi:hypothetical protein
MTKTSTFSNLVSKPNEKSDIMTANQATQQEELFYNSIKKQLNELVKEPSDETIQKILTFSKNL